MPLPPHHPPLFYPLSPETFLPTKKNVPANNILQSLNPQNHGSEKNQCNRCNQKSIGVIPKSKINEIIEIKKINGPC
jgi:hypothetical protein